MPLVRLEISFSCEQMSRMAPPPALAPARPPPAPPCPLPAAPLWLSARGSRISALPFPGMGCPVCPLPCVLDTHDIPGFGILKLRSCPPPPPSFSLSNWSLGSSDWWLGPSDSCPESSFPRHQFPPQTEGFLLFIPVSQGGAGGVCKRPIPVLTSRTDAGLE